MKSTSIRFETTHLQILRNAYFFPNNFQFNLLIKQIKNGNIRAWRIII